MQYIYVTSKQEYDQLMDIFEKKGWKSEDGKTPRGYFYDSGCVIENSNSFNRLTTSAAKAFGHSIISFQDYLKQEANTNDPNPIQFGDLVDARDNDTEGFPHSPVVFLGKKDGVYYTLGFECSLEGIEDLEEILTWDEVRKHEEEKVTITITKSEYEKVKEFLNK